ncbi:MAG TPA: hypothetical protein VF158_16225 [Longimicrobiales bacterium]
MTIDKSGKERARAVTVEVAAGFEVTVYERADADAVIAAAIEDPGVDPYAAVLWPAAVAVARELVGRVGPGDRVVELGAGTGLCALTAARLGAASLAADHDAAALDRIARAAELQGVAVEVLRFDVCGPAPLPPGDVVVLADLLYEAELARAAARRVVEAVERGARVVVGDPGRVGRPEFVRALARRGLDVDFRNVEVRLPGERFASTVGVAWMRRDQADPGRGTA